MTAVFLDTVGLLALWDIADQWHAAAEIAFQQLRANRTPLITTSFVLLECGNSASRRSYRLEADQLRRLLESRNELIVPTADDWQLAWEMYRRGDADQAGIVDCTSIVIMRRLGLKEAFTNDRHFAMAGMITLF
jgi:predicted nucleic acid-binding protein